MTYSAPANTHGCWTLAVAAIREQLVRSGREAPANAGERRQAMQGPVPVNQLDAVQCGKN